MIQPVGCVTVDVYHQDKSFQLPCLVIKGTGPSRLGKDWLEHLKLNWRIASFPDMFSEDLGTLKGL